VLLATGAVVTVVIMASAGGRHDCGCAWRGANVIRSIPTIRSLSWSSPGIAPGGTRLARVSLADSSSAPASVLVYSSFPEVRDAVRTAVGRRPAADVGPLTWIECATGDEVVAAVRDGGIDLCILDGDAQPTGGLALSRQLDQEVAERPAVCVLIARQADRWLAHWSRAEATLPKPVDPLVAPGVVAQLLRERVRPSVRG